MGKDINAIIEKKVDGKWFPCTEAGEVLIVKSLSSLQNKVSEVDFFCKEHDALYSDLIADTCSFDIVRNYVIYDCLLGWADKRESKYDQITPVFVPRDTDSEVSLAYQVMAEYEKRYHYYLVLQDFIDFYATTPVVTDGMTGKTGLLQEHRYNEILLGLKQRLENLSENDGDVRILLSYG